LNVKNEKEETKSMCAREPEWIFRQGKPCDANGEVHWGEENLPGKGTNHLLVGEITS